ncbi:MAG: H/ACA ribonucleoprotein complex subunit GAR1 [Halobacteriales archaeon]
MRRIGEVARVAAGTVVVRSPDDTYPAIGTEVIDERLDRIGRVVDVMGPTERPYLVVSPEAEAPPAALLNEPVYVR